jgi:hypothetical protein
MVKGLEEAKAALIKAKNEYIMYYNHQHEPAPVFTPGDKVWLDGSDITTNQPSLKLSHCQLGPFTIKACIGHGAYHLNLPPQLQQLYPIFPVVKLSITIPDLISGCQPAPPPPPTLIDGGDKYEVKAILDSQMRYNHLKYLVEWKGYNDGHNSWQVHRQFHA